MSNDRLVPMTGNRRRRCSVIEDRAREDLDVAVPETLVLVNEQIDQRVGVTEIALHRPGQNEEVAAPGVLAASSAGSSTGYGTTGGSRQPVSPGQRRGKKRGQ